MTNEELSKAISEAYQMLTRIGIITSRDMDMIDTLPKHFEDLLAIQRERAREILTPEDTDGEVGT